MMEMFTFFILFEQNQRKFYQNEMDLVFWWRKNESSGIHINFIEAGRERENGTNG